MPRRELFIRIFKSFVALSVSRQIIFCLSAQDVQSSCIRNRGGIIHHLACLIVKRNHTEIAMDEKVPVVILSKDLNIIVIGNSQITSLSKMADPIRRLEHTLMLTQVALCSVKSERPFLGIHIPVDRLGHI